MTARVDKYYEKKTWAPGALSKGLRRILETLVDNPDAVRIGWSRKLPGGMEETRDEYLSTLDSLCEIGKGEGINTDFRSRDNQLIWFRLTGLADSLYFFLGAPSPAMTQELATMIGEALSLSPWEATESQPETVSETTHRLPTFRCFLSHRFYPHSEAAAAKIQRFLGLLNVEVVTGLGYEPRRISEKVTDRLAKIWTSLCTFSLRTVSPHGYETKWALPERGTCQSSSSLRKAQDWSLASWPTTSI